MHRAEGQISELSPNHLINNTCIRLYDLHDLSGNVFLNVIRYGNTVITVSTHINSRRNSLQKAVFINSRKNEASLIKCLGTLG